MRLPTGYAALRSLPLGGRVLVWLINITGILLQIAWVASFLYGTYCVIRAWGLRNPATTRHKNPLPTLDDFKPLGRAFLKRAVQSWAVALGVIILATIVF